MNTYTWLSQSKIFPLTKRWQQKFVLLTLLIALFALLEPAITLAAGTIRLSREGSSYTNGITLVGLGSTTAGTAGTAMNFAITNTATDSSTLNITDIIVPANVEVSTTALNITDDTNGTVKQTFTLKIAASATANVKGKVTIINDAVADYPVSGKSPNPFIFYVNGTVKGTDTNTDTTDTTTSDTITNINLAPPASSAASTTSVTFTATPSAATTALTTISCNVTGTGTLTSFTPTSIAAGITTATSIPVNLSAIVDKDTVQCALTNTTDTISGSPASFIFNLSPPPSAKPELDIWDGNTEIKHEFTNAINFGATVIGSPVEKNITLKNPSATTLNIYDVNPPEGFRLASTNLNFTILAGQELTIKVLLEAITAGTFEGPFTVASNDSDDEDGIENPYTFFVKGLVTDNTTNTLTFTTPSNGNVSSNTGSINCGNGNTNCSADYGNDNSVILTAIANTGTIFTSWGGDCSDSTNPLILPMDADKNCTANFTITVNNTNGSNSGGTAPTVDLTVNPPTNGFVISQPPGISCGTGITDCQASYIKDNTVVLIAKADQGATFNGWDDDCSGTTSPIVIAMDGAKTCTANFVITPTSPEIQVLDGETDIVAGINVTNFGITAIGTSLSKIFTVKNIGNAELTLASTISFIGDGFTAGKFGTTTLAPSATTTFTVT